MKFECSKKKMECQKLFSYKDNAIFVWSKGTCVADEVFTQFFACRGNREMHFSSYVSEMTQNYKENYIGSADFLSVNTFTSCVMSWIVNLDIDFRGKDAICPFCGHNPEILACDGVAVGVSLKYLAELKSISAPEKPEVKPMLHRRFTRTLVRGTGKTMAHLRKFLHSFCKSILNIGKNKSLEIDLPVKDDGKQTIQNSDFIQNELLEVMKDHRCRTVLKSLFDQEYPLELAKTMAQFIINLNGTAALTNFFPLKDREWLIKTFSNHQDTHLSEMEMYGEIKKLKEFRTQFAGIIKTALRYNQLYEICGFFKYLIETTNEIHSKDHLFMPDEPQIIDSYDPTKGVAYHFTEHGGQIRKLPKYEMEGNKILNQNRKKFKKMQ